jgi:hypothetical protein
VQRDDRDEAAGAEDRRHDLRGEASVGFEHALVGRIVECRPGIILHDLTALTELEDDGLRPQVDGPLVSKGCDPRRQRLVRDREVVATRYVLPERDAARARCREQLQEDRLDLVHESVQAVSGA